MIKTSFNLRPSEERRKIAIYDLQAKTLSFVFVGSRAVYTPEYKKIVFYDRNEKLSIADIDGDSESEEVIDTYSSAVPVSVVPISRNEFIYESKRSGAHCIWKYSFDSGQATELTGLKSCSLNYAVWRSATNELLCTEILENGRFTGE